MIREGYTLFIYGRRCACVLHIVICHNLVQMVLFYTRVFDEVSAICNKIDIIN